MPPSELSRFGAGLSGSGDILVPQVIPPDEIREIWIARNCSAEIDQHTKEKRWVHHITEKDILQETGGRDCNVRRFQDTLVFKVSWQQGNK